VDESMKNRGRGLEDEYFRRQEQELIEKLRKRGEEAAKRRELSERTGVADEEVLGDLRALGYTPDTVALLHLVPLVQIAWAEGNVSERERELIVKAARSHGVAAGSDADRQLTAWLDTQPSSDFFQKNLRAIRVMLEAQSPETREASQRDLLTYCTSIASASGGIMGFGKVSDDERKLLEQISTELQRSHPTARVDM
jgi:hypothetical protein